MPTQLQQNSVLKVTTPKMLIKGFSTPSQDSSMRKIATTQQTPSQQLINKSPRDIKSHQRSIPLIGLHHLLHCQRHHHQQQPQQQQQQRQQHLQRQQRCILLLIALILLQQIELHTCHRLSQRSSSDEQSASSAALDSQNFDSSFASKRAELIHGSGVGQPEEVFTIDDQMESNYDEYPMIVPKRAALLLDRLMVALHHALEKERNQQRRIGELNELKNNGNEVSQNEGQNPNEPGAELKEGAPYFDSMYGDDPTVLMDYDFKDLNSINRATGETLMGKSFQRRANIGGADNVALLTSAGGPMKGANIGLMSAAGSGRASKGRMYWRCYFNAVSCF